MDRFLIVTNDGKDKDYTVTNRDTGIYLNKPGRSVIYA